MDYWYIWYQVYEDGEPLANGRGRYYYPYKHKASAKRRAEQMWSEDVIDTRTGKVISRTWTVSRTNPWNDIYYVKTKADAEKIAIIIKQLCERYGYATRADVKDCLNETVGMIDRQFGWVTNKIDDIKIYPANVGYLVEFPRAALIC